MHRGRHRPLLCKAVASAAAGQPVLWALPHRRKRCFKTTEQLGSYLMEKFAWSDYERAMLVSSETPAARAKQPSGYGRAPPTG